MWWLLRHEEGVVSIGTNTHYERYLDFFLHVLIKKSSFLVRKEDFLIFSDIAESAITRLAILPLIPFSVL
jgi:hypothetical protein